jgi:hypothetical protein
MTLLKARLVDVESRLTFAGRNWSGPFLWRDCAGAHAGVSLLELGVNVGLTSLATGAASRRATSCPSGPVDLLGFLVRA